MRVTKVNRELYLIQQKQSVIWTNEEISLMTRSSSVDNNDAPINSNFGMVVDLEAMRDFEVADAFIGQSINLLLSML